MQRTCLILGLAATLAFCACSGGPKKSVARNAAGSPETTAVATPESASAIAARLQGALLTLGDLPAGWATSAAASAGSATGTDFCGVPGVASQELGRAEADFQRGDLGPFVSETLAQAEPGVIKSELDVIAAALPGCPPQTQTQADGSSLTYTLTPLAFPTLGEQTVAAQLKVAGSLLPIQGVAIFVRRANSVVSLTVLAVGLAAPDAALTEMLARRADAKFAPVAR